MESALPPPSKGVSRSIPKPYGSPELYSTGDQTIPVPPSSVSMGVVPPMFSAAEALPSGAVLATFRTSPWPGEVLWDNTSVSSAACGRKARGGVSLSIISGAKEFHADDDC